MKDTLAGTMTGERGMIAGTGHDCVCVLVWVE
jgi:hypothetical protein